MPKSHFPFFRPMYPRSSDESHRAATPLELFFDLVFVVAIAQASGQLHHALAENHISEGIFFFLAAFFAIWWAWMNFTWFASAYDNGDVVYKLTVFLQLIGAMIFAAGITAFMQGNLLIVVSGFVIMRIAMIIQWLRAANSDPSRRKTSLRYALGITLCQIGWISLLFWPEDLFIAGIILFVIAELLVPAWAESATPTPWHAEHITERYGLLTIIVLGESVLALSLGIESVISAGIMTPNIVLLIVGGHIILFSMWWFYFDWHKSELINTFSRAFIFGYGHYFIFAATAATGAGLALGIEHQLHPTHLSNPGINLAIALPVAIYLLVLWLMFIRLETPTFGQRYLMPVFIVLVLFTPLAGTICPLLIGILLLSLLILKRYIP